MVSRFMSPGSTAGSLVVEPAPDLTSSWDAIELDTRMVERELDRLWAEVSARRNRNRKRRSSAESDVGLMRASTLNLIVAVESPSDAVDAEAVISQLSELTPSRTVVLVRSPERADAPTLTIKVAVHQHESSKGRPGVQFECITIGVKGEPSTSLASVASSLLVPELPIFLWWCGPSLPTAELFGELAEISDRIVVDTATLANRGRTLIELASLVQRSKAGPKATDFAWTRLMPWRQVIAQFFDPVDAQKSLDTIDEVVIFYERKTEAKNSGLTSALLAAGWLSTRLGWQAPGELVRTHNGWRVTLRAGKAGRRREVILRLQPSDQAEDLCLSKLSLSAIAPAAGFFSIERAGANTLTTKSESEGGPAVSRAVYLHLQDTVALLEHELGQFGRDPVFEESLTFAAALVPEGELDE
jgi:glucose-6-phosphate dehydrogenase assembly protein OpcA